MPICFVSQKRCGKNTRKYPGFFSSLVNCRCAHPRAPEQERNPRTSLPLGKLAEMVCLFSFEWYMGFCGFGASCPSASAAATPPPPSHGQISIKRNAISSRKCTLERGVAGSRPFGALGRPWAPRHWSVNYISYLDHAIWQLHTFHTFGCCHHQHWWCDTNGSKTNRETILSIGHIAYDVVCIRCVRAWKKDVPFVWRVCCFPSWWVPRNEESKKNGKII